jgi:hypothetical protein
MAGALNSRFAAGPVTGRSENIMLRGYAFNNGCLCRQRRRRGLLFPFHAVDALDHQENGKSYDDEDPRLRVTAPAALATAREA